MNPVRKLLVLLLAALLLVAAPAGCAGDTAPEQTPAGSVAVPEQTPAGISIHDMTDRLVELDAPADRIVALMPADCEILFALGAGDTLVGRGEYCEYPEQVKDIPAVASGGELSIEQIIALEPQVVIMSKMAQTPQQVEALESAGIRCAVSDAQDIAGVYEAIALLGALTGRIDEADAIVLDMRSTFDEIAARSQADGTQTVYFEVSPLEWGLWTGGKGTFMDELATMLGVENIFSDVEGWGEISEEQVLERDPDFIVTIAMYFGEGETPVEEIMGRSGWQGLTAVKNGAVLNADSNEISLPGPRLVGAAETLCDFFNGGTPGGLAA